MTESEWLACPDPERMLAFLRGSGKASDRKVTLFACACCRTVWRLISEGVFREAIKAAEEHADGGASDKVLGTAVRAAHRARRKRNTLERAAYDTARSGGALGVSHDVARVVATRAAPNPSPTATSCVVGDQVVTQSVPPNADRLAWDAAFAAHLRLETSLLRDSFGPLPFRPFTLPPVVLAWDDRCIHRLAATIYQERDFSEQRMGVLADALEEAGCTEAELLDHLRGVGPHVRGCWAVDLILGKE